MKLSTRARYALRMMLELARADPDGPPLSMTAIAQRTNISKSYLEQLAIPMKDADLIKGRAGRTGGYKLARRATEIRVREIVEAAIGPINLVDCVGNPEQCNRAGDCESRIIWGLLNHRVRSMLEEYALADLADPRFVAGVRVALADVLIVPDSTTATQDLCAVDWARDDPPSRGRRRRGG